VVVQQILIQKLQSIASTGNSPTTGNSWWILIKEAIVLSGEWLNGMVRSRGNFSNITQRREGHTHKIATFK